MSLLWWIGLSLLVGSSVCWIGWMFYGAGFRAGFCAGQHSAREFSGDTSVELIGIAIECVDEATSPLSHTLPWSKPALESAREALARAYKSETEAL